MNDTVHEQIEINGVQVDMGLSVLLSILWDKGLTTRSSCQGRGPTPETTMSFIIFPQVADAVYFITQSAVLTNFKTGDRMVLSIQHPQGDVTAEPEAKVTWLPDWTAGLGKVWIESSYG